MIYRLRFDRFNFLVGDISFNEVKAKTGDHFALDAPLWSDIWRPMEITFRDDSDEQNVPIPPDITCWLTDNLFLNKKAYDSIESQLTKYGELLPCTCEGTPYWILHVTHKTNMNAVDLSNSERIVEAGGYIDMQSLAFNETKLNNALIFKTEFSNYRNIYCTEKFKSLVEAAELKGLLFSNDLACINEP